MIVVRAAGDVLGDSVACYFGGSGNSFGHLTNNIWSAFQSIDLYKTMFGGIRKLYGDWQGPEGDSCLFCQDFWRSRKHVAVQSRSHPAFGNFSLS